MSSPCTHSHSHFPTHAHSHAPKHFHRPFAIGVMLNLVFVLVEGVVGWRVNSLALLADAGHNLSDVAGLLLAWGAAWVSRLQPTSHRTYGWRRSTILAAVGNGMLLLVAMGSLGWEAIQRLKQPAPIPGEVMMVVAAIGILINASTAWLFFRDQQQDLNRRGAFLHMVADALVSAGVVVAGMLAYVWGWLWVDPAISLLLAAIIIVGTWSLLTQSLHLLFDGVPAHIAPDDVRDYLTTLPGVSRVHDLHIWAIGTSDVALTAHLLCPDGPPNDAFYREATKGLHDRFEITHVTLQVMRDPVAPSCAP